jgi:hypothetical protein
MLQRIMIRVGLVLLPSLCLPSLARATSEGVGASGMHAVTTAQPPAPPRPLAALKQLLQQLTDTHALVHGSVSDAVAEQLGRQHAAQSSSLLRR